MANAKALVINEADETEKLHHGTFAYFPFANTGSIQLHFILFPSVSPSPASSGASELKK